MKNDMFKTHRTKLQKVYSSLVLRQKMNSECTQMILGKTNDKKLEEALKHVNDAIYVLRSTTAVLLLITLLSFKSYSQTFIGIHGNSLGVGLHAGAEVNNIAFTVGFNKPVFSSELPLLAYSTIGYVYKFSEDDPFSISLHAGGAYSQAKEVSKDFGTVIPINKFIGMGNVEIGKTWHTGKLFLNAGYAGKIFFGAGMKVFIK